ncbi:MAG: hypothetical protein V4654_02450 [Bdellovibrionota bacterium]
MIQLNREIKILTLFLTMAYGVWAEAQSQPQANGYGLGTGAGSVSATQTTTNSTKSTTNTTPSTTNSVPIAPGQNSNAGGGPSSVEQTEPGQVTTVNPMDPVNDSRKANDSQMLDIRRKRAMAPPVSATAEPTTEPPAGY